MDQIQVVLDEQDPQTGISLGERMARIICGMALAGDMRAAELILRRFAPEKLAVELSGPDKSAIPIEWVQDAHRKLDELLEHQSPEEVLERIQ